MPVELLETYCRRICAMLRKRINGTIYVNGTYDEIVTEITWSDFQYQIVINNVSNMIYRGISSEYISRWICEDFKNAMLKEVFV